MVCESSLHAGTGSDLDIIDKPIQRERHTGYPKIEGSGIKGAWRERIASQLEQSNQLPRGDGNKDPRMNGSFGPFSPETGSERQGALTFSDARLLLFPVKSMKGVFAWVTSISILRRFAQDWARVPGHKELEVEMFDEANDAEARVFSRELEIPGTQGNTIVLEEFAFQTFEDTESHVDNIRLNQWLANTIYPLNNEHNKYWNKQLRQNLVILKEEDFRDFAELTTEVITRNKINPETGTVADGHLFSEEYLPSDSIMYSLVMAHPEFKKDGQSADEVLGFFHQQASEVCHNTLQIGGNATIGKGMVRTVFVSPETQTPTP